MRRTGAQLLTAVGVEPWFVRWFGRWGSPAMLAYIEDARAKAPEAAGLAERVRLALLGGAHAASVPEPTTADHTPPQLPVIEDAQECAKPQAAGGAEAQDLVDMVRSIVAEHLAEADKEGKIVYVQNRVTGFVHVSVSEGARALPRTSLCGWRFGSGRLGTAQVAQSRGGLSGAICGRCAARAIKLGLPIECADEAGGPGALLPAPSSSSDSDSSSADATRAGARPRA